MLGRSVDRPDGIARRCGRGVVALVDQAVEFRFQRRLHLVTQLASAGGEQLDAVVRILVVRRRDHRSADAFVRGRPGNGRRRHDAHRRNRDPFGREPSRQRDLQHGTGHARVAADHELVAVQHARRRAPESRDELRREVEVGNPAHTIGPEPERHDDSPAFDGTSNTLLCCGYRQNGRRISACCTAEPSWPS